MKSLTYKRRSEAGSIPALGAVAAHRYLPEFRVLAARSSSPLWERSTVMRRWFTVTHWATFLFEDIFYDPAICWSRQAIRAIVHGAASWVHG